MLYINTRPISQMREWRFRTFSRLGCWVAEAGLESAGPAWLQAPFLLPVECGWCPVLRGGGVWSSGPGQREGRRNGPGKGAEVEHREPVPGQEESHLKVQQKK